MQTVKDNKHCNLIKNSEWLLKASQNPMKHLSSFSMWKWEINIKSWSLFNTLFGAALPLLHYCTCYLLDASIHSDLHTQYCGQSPQEQFGVKCLRDTTTCWLQWGLNLWPPDPNTYGQPTTPHAPVTPVTPVTVYAFILDAQVFPEYYCIVSIKKRLNSLVFHK